MDKPAPNDLSRARREGPLSSTQPPSPSRRTVIAAAWAVPVIALTAAVPAAAASVQPPTPRVDDIAITTIESNFIRTVFHLVVTGVGFGEVIWVSWETNDWNVAYPQAFTQFLTHSAEQAIGRIEIPAWYEEVVEYEARLEVTIGGRTVAYDYTRRP